MALSKIVTYPNGVQVSYHRIARAHVDFLAMQTTVEVMSYVSKDVRAGDQANSLFVEPSHALQLAGVPDTTDREWAYSQMKAQLPDWADAQDA